MDDPNAIIAVTVFVTMPALYCVAGQVDVVSLWSQRPPHVHLWRGQALPRPTTWKTTKLPDAHSGRF